MTTVMKSVSAGAAHEKLRHDLLAVIRREASDMPADQVLAVVCVLVGQLVAHQDQRKFTPDAVMAMVASNIELGNQAALRDFLAMPGGHA